MEVRGPSTYYRDNAGYLWVLHAKQRAIPLKVRQTICVLDAMVNEVGFARIGDVGYRWQVRRTGTDGIVIADSESKVGYYFYKGGD